MPAHHRRNRIIAGAEPRRHLRQRGSRLRLAGALRGAESFVFGGVIRFSVRDMPDRLDCGDVEICETLELRIILVIGFHGDGSTPQHCQGIQPFVFVAVDVGEINHRRDRIVVTRAKFGLRDRQRTVEPRPRIGVIPCPDIEKRDGTQITDETRMLRPQHAFVDFQLTIEILRGLFEAPDLVRSRLDRDAGLRS